MATNVPESGLLESQKNDVCKWGVVSEDEGDDDDMRVSAADLVSQWPSIGVMPSGYRNI